MMTLVRVIFPQPGSGTADLVFSYAGLSTCDAICRALDELDARGLGSDSATCVSIVAKRGPGASALVCAHHAVIAEPAQEVEPCAA